MNTDEHRSVFICGFAFGCGSTALWNSWPIKPPRIKLVALRQKSVIGHRGTGARRKTRHEPQRPEKNLLCGAVAKEASLASRGGGNGNEAAAKQLLLCAMRHGQESERLRSLSCVRA